MENISRKDIEDSKEKQESAENTNNLRSFFLPELKINGGVLRSVTQDGMHGVMYYGNNGTTCFFSGVKMSSTPIDGSAFQMHGIIFVSPGWVSRGFDVYDFAHEYGHYIQQQVLPTLAYYAIAGMSVYSYVTNTPEEHMNKPWEVQATTLGNEYLRAHMKYN